MHYEVFATSISDADDAATVASGLLALYPHASISFDLDDCDRILRVGGAGIHAHHIIAQMEGLGHSCRVLE